MAADENNRHVRGLRGGCRGAAGVVRRVVYSDAGPDLGNDSRARGGFIRSGAAVPVFSDRVRQRADNGNGFYRGFIEGKQIAGVLQQNNRFLAHQFRCRLMRGRLGRVGGPYVGIGHLGRRVENAQPHLCPYNAFYDGVEIGGR